MTKSKVRKGYKEIAGKGKAPKKAKPPANQAKLVAHLNASLAFPFDSTELLGALVAGASLHDEAVTALLAIDPKRGATIETLAKGLGRSEDDVEELLDDLEGASLVRENDEEEKYELTPFALFGSLKMFVEGTQDDGPSKAKLRAWACGDIPLGFWTEYGGSTKERKDSLRAFLAAAQYHYEADCGGHHEVGPWEYEIEVRTGRAWKRLPSKEDVTL